MKVHPWAAATAAFAAGSLAAVGIAQATSAPTKIPDSSTGVITACFVKKTGAVRFINAQAGKVCKSGEKKVTFNNKGPAGPTGPTGPTGATGATGATGDRGPSNGFVKTNNTNKTLLENPPIFGNNNVISLSLDAGKYIVSATTQVRSTVASTDEVSCELTGPAGTVEQRHVTWTVPAQDQFQPFSVVGSYSNPAAGSVTLRCTPYDANLFTQTGEAQSSGATITATKVADLTVQ